VRRDVLRGGAMIRRLRLRGKAAAGEDRLLSNGLSERLGQVVSGRRERTGR